MKKNRAMRIAVLLLALLAGLIVPGLDDRLNVVHYAIDAEEITVPVRIALVTDLHSCAYGEGQRELIDAVDAENPDIVLLGGDIFDDKLPDDNAKAFLAGIADRYPCWYVTGNHEHWAGKRRFARQMDILDELDIARLGGQAILYAADGQRFTLCGVDDPMQWNGSEKEYKKQVQNLTGAEGFTVLLAHRPEYAAFYAECGFSLVLAGHAHGGQWRVPGLINGLFAPNQGFFPQYAGGSYRIGDTTLIVSRGLARESTRLPRVYNRPELVIVELTNGAGQGVQTEKGEP